MLRLPIFQLEQPDTVLAAIAALEAHRDDARVLAGGTDVLPTLKLGMPSASLLVSLRGVRELSSISVIDNEVRIGTGVTLHDVATSPVVKQRLPALASAASWVASPQIRRLATLGGNICLDTRCRYVNQSELFREALGGCLKSHGDACHVVPGGTSCVAALSSDTILPLIALGARVDVQGAGGVRTIPVEALRGADGRKPLLLGHSEIVTTVRVATPGPTTLCVARKWAVRRSIDFPLVSLAVRLDVDGDDRTIVQDGKLVLGVLGPKPRIVSLEALRGERLTEALATQVGEIALANAKTLPNVPYDPVYRRERIAVEARRAVRSMVK